MNPFFLVAALADLTGVAVHGVVGHRLFLTPLTSRHLFATKEFGNAERSRRVFVVTWHAVTAAFATSAVMMFLLTFGAVTSRPTALFVSAMHIGFLLVGVVVSGPRAFRRPLKPIPVAFVIAMSTVALMGWLGSR